MIDKADGWIAALGLVPHPEGGYYRETYGSADLIGPEGLPARFSGRRRASTAIYFLLRGSQHSALHRLRADEIWHHYAGSSLTLHQIRPDGGILQARLGKLAGTDGAPQVLVPAGCWFGATVDDPDSYALVGCTVSPGFVVEDFELGDTAALVAEFPQHEQLIRRLAPPAAAP